MMFYNVGCNSENSSKNTIAYVSENADSEYCNTFKKLQLGTFWDFDLKLMNADESWVTIWVEGYNNGKAVQPAHLIELSYGLNPRKVVEEQMGLGIINYNDKPQIFIQSGGAKTEFRSIDTNLISKNIPSCWDYAIGDKPVDIESGEEIILATYRQNNGPLRAGYDYTDSNSIKQMINENTSVLILKLKVENKKKL